jgi:hypothetical protein
MNRTILSLTLASLALTGASCSSFWQAETTGQAFQHGTYRVGGAANLNYQDQEFNGVDTNTLAANLDLGRFYGEHLELGVRVGHSTTEVGTAETDRTVLALFGRWYTTHEGALRPFVELGAGAASIDDGTVDVSGETIFLAAGLVQFLAQQVAGEIVIRQSTSSFDDGIDGDSLDVGLGISVFW